MSDPFKLWRENHNGIDDKGYDYNDSKEPFSHQILNKDIPVG